MLARFAYAIAFVIACAIVVANSIIIITFAQFFS
jgi:hypothetical protein